MVGIFESMWAMRTVRLAAVVCSCTLFLAACASNSTSVDSTSATSTSAVTSPAAGADATELEVTAPQGATMTGFRETTLEAPAGAGIDITFRNEDKDVLHNIQLFSGTSTVGTPVWAPSDNAMITGPAETVYRIPALAPGEYAFNCYAHPATMVGTLTVT